MTTTLNDVTAKKKPQPSAEELEVPRDRDGTFEPVIVKKRQRRLTEVDEIVCRCMPGV